MMRANIAHRARVGAGSGLVGAMVATLVAGSLLVALAGGGTIRHPLESVALVFYGGLLGLVYVGWISVPVGAIVGCLAFVVLDTRLTDSSGKYWAMAVGAAAGLLFVGPFVLVEIGHGAPTRLLGIGAAPCALGGLAAWKFEQVWSRRGMPTADGDRARGDEPPKPIAPAGVDR